MAGWAEGLIALWVFLCLADLGAMTLVLWRQRMDDEAKIELIRQRMDWFTAALLRLQWEQPEQDKKVSALIDALAGTPQSDEPTSA